MATYKHLIQWKQDPRNMLQMTGSNDGVSFTTQGDLPGSQGHTNSNATTTNDGATAGHSFTTQGGAERG